MLSQDIRFTVGDCFSKYELALTAISLKKIISEEEIEGLTKIILSTGFSAILPLDKFFSNLQSKLDLTRNTHEVIVKLYNLVQLILLGYRDNYEYYASLKD